MIRVLVSATILFGYACSALADPPGSALWDSDNSAAIAAIPGRVTAYLRQQDGTFLEVDLSAAEGGTSANLGNVQLSATVLRQNQ